MNTLRYPLLLVTAAAVWVGCSPVDDGGDPARGGAAGSGGTPGASQGGAGGSGAQPSSGGSAGALVTGGSGGGATGGSSGAPSVGGASAGTGNAGAAAGGSAGSSANGGAGGSGGSSGASGGAGGSSGAAGRGGGGSGGAAGSGGTSGGATAGGTGKACGSPDLVLCEDFESTADGAIPMGWTRQGAAAVASDQKRGGMRSLKVSPAPNGARRISHSAATFGTAFWGRVYYRVQTPVPDAFVHSTFVELSGTRPGAGGTAAYRVVDTVKNAGANAKHQFLFNIQPSGNEFGVGSSYDWTFDAMWHCAEWQIDNANQSYSFFIDGVEVPSIRVLNGMAVSGNGRGEVPTAFTQLHVGLNNYQSAPPGFTVWIDDVAISKARVGCLM